MCYNQGSSVVLISMADLGHNSSSAYQIPPPKFKNNGIYSEIFFSVKLLKHLAEGN